MYNVSITMCLTDNTSVATVVETNQHHSVEREPFGPHMSFLPGSMSAFANLQKTTRFDT